MEAGILVVSGDAATRGMVAQVAERVGHGVTVALDAPAARCAVVGRMFEIVILDWALPDRGGPALCTELSGAPEGDRPYLLVLAALEHADDPSPIFAARADDYLLPPLAPARVAARVQIATRAVIESRRRRSAEETLRRQEQFSAAVLETLGSLVVVLDSEGRIILFNRACEATTGYTASEITGRVFWDLLVPPDELEGVRTTFQRLRAGEFPSSYENDWVAKDGRRRRIAWSNSAMTDDGGKVRYVIGTGLDVTEARALGERAGRADRLRALGNLAAGLAHEIRNPLNAASLQLLLVERRLNGAGASPDISGAVRATQLVRDELQRLQALVEDVLLFARPARPHVSRADLAETVRGVYQLLAPDAAATGVTVQTVLEGRVEARCDPERVKQVLINLVRNGMEATGSGGTVTIAARRLSGRVEITVTDTGPGVVDGIDPWEPFVTTKEKGTGLGLPTVQRIVHEHGGSVRIYRKDDRTVAEVVLPLVGGGC